MVDASSGKTHFYGDGCPDHVCPNEPHEQSERGEAYCALCGKVFEDQRERRGHSGASGS